MTSPAEIRPGIIKAWNGGAYTATIQLVGSLTTWLANVPVARDIAGAEMVVGRKVAVVMYDPTNPADSAVLAVHT